MTNDRRHDYSATASTLQVTVRQLEALAFIAISSASLSCACAPLPTVTGTNGSSSESTTVSTSTSENTADGIAWCADKDDDGYGNLDDCIPGIPGEEPPNGYVEDESREPKTDCDDENAFAFPGAAQLEAPEKCMEDEDDDGWGDIAPSDGVVPGTDCNDKSNSTYPGAAPNDAPSQCMKDEDGDDWGDNAPPEGVPPGTDCDDGHDQTFPGAAQNELDPTECMRDEDDDGFGDSSPPDGVTPGSDCNDTDEEVASCLALTVDAGESMCIAPGAMAQLQAVAMGGDEPYVWDWTPPESLDDPKIDNPIATPMGTTTYTVTVTDSQNDMASDSILVFNKDAELLLDEVACKETNFQWGGLPISNWSWNPNPGELCQLTNGTPSSSICGWSLDNANIQGRFQVKTVADDDYVGFLWGIQPFNQKTMEPEQFYFMGWKEKSQLGFCGNQSPQSGKAGIIVKRIDVLDSMSAPLTCADFHDPNDTINSVVLADESEFSNMGWLDNIPYLFDLTHTPAGFTIKVIREDNMQVVAEKEFEDDTYPNGQVGFYAFSQQDVCFSQFKTGCP